MNQETEADFDPWKSPLAHLIALEERKIANLLWEEARILTPLMAKEVSPDERQTARRGIVNLAVLDPTLNRYFTKCACRNLDTALMLQSATGDKTREIKEKIAQVLLHRNKELKKCLEPVTPDVISLHRLRDNNSQNQMDTWLTEAKQDPSKLAADDLVQLLPISPDELSQSKQGELHFTSLYEESYKERCGRDLTIEDLNTNNVVDLIVNGPWGVVGHQESLGSSLPEEWEEFLEALSQSGMNSNTPELLHRRFYRWMLPVSFHGMPLAMIAASFHGPMSSGKSNKDKKFKETAKEALEKIEITSSVLAIELKNLRASMAALYLDPRGINSSSHPTKEEIQKGFTVLFGCQTSSEPPPGIEYAKFSVELHGETHDTYHPKYECKDCKKNNSEATVDALHDNLRIALNIATGTPVALDANEPKPFDEGKFSQLLTTTRKEVLPKDMGKTHISHDLFAKWLMLELAHYVRAFKNAERKEWNRKIFSIRLNRTKGSIAMLLLNKLSNRDGNKTNQKTSSILWSYELIDSPALLGQLQDKKNPFLDEKSEININETKYAIFQIKHEIIKDGDTYNQKIRDFIEKPPPKDNSDLSNAGLYLNVAAEGGGKEISYVMIGFGITPTSENLEKAEQIQLEQPFGWFVSAIKKIKATTVQ